MTDFADWQQPQAAANAISTTGAPALRLTNNLGSNASQALSPNTPVQLLNTTNLNQPGYEGVFTVTMPAGQGSIPFIKVVIVWTDQTTGLTVGQRTFFMTCGNGQLLSYYIHGPVKGNQVSITATCLDSTITATLGWGFNLTSHVYLSDNIIQTAYGTLAPNGYTNPAGFPNAGLLLDSNPSVAANSTTTRLIAVYSGRAVLGVNNTSASGVNISVWLVDPVASGAGLYGNPQSRYAGVQNIGPGATQVVAVALPYGPFNLQIVNLSTTTAATMNIGLVAEDY